MEFDKSKKIKNQGVKSYAVTDTYGEYSMDDISIPVPDESIGEVIVLDTFDDLNRNGGFIMSASKISGQQSVSMFDIYEEKS